MNNRCAARTYRKNGLRCKNKKCLLANNPYQYCYMHLQTNIYDTDCCICTEMISKELEDPLECGHVIHRKCLFRWALNRVSDFDMSDVCICPLCRRSVSLREWEQRQLMQEQVENEIQWRFRPVVLSEIQIDQLLMSIYQYYQEVN
jgi:hypothetical protein